jgi:hypothetical protein
MRSLGRRGVSALPDYFEKRNAIGAEEFVGALRAAVSREMRAITIGAPTRIPNPFIQQGPDVTGRNHLTHIALQMKYREIRRKKKILCTDYNGKECVPNRPVRKGIQ